MQTGMDDGAARQLADQVGRAMMARDASSRFLGVRLEEIRPGYARMSMTVTRDMLNALDRCHGGFTYKLADDAFAYACNSYNRPAVGLSCSITYPAAAREGDVLIAVCEERHRKGRSGTYDSTVTNQDGEVVALFRGHCRVLDGRIVDLGAVGRYGERQADGGGGVAVSMWQDWWVRRS